jgi:sulfur carrier protein
MHPTPLHSSGTPVTVRVNDKPHTVADRTTLTQLLAGLGLSAAQGVAVAINDAVVPRSSWEEHCLAEGDQVLVIQATQGG